MQDGLSIGQQPGSSAHCRLQGQAGVMEEGRRIIIALFSSLLRLSCYASLAVLISLVGGRYSYQHQRLRP